MKKGRSRTHAPLHATGEVFGRVYVPGAPDAFSQAQKQREDNQRETIRYLDSDPILGSVSRGHLEGSCLQDTLFPETCKSVDIGVPEPVRTVHLP